MPTTKDSQRPKVAPWPKSAINDQSDGRGTIDLVHGATGEKVNARKQPAIWQPIASAYLPGNKANGDHNGAAFGDLIVSDDGLMWFNGFAWQPVNAGLSTRYGITDNFLQPPRLYSAFAGNAPMTFSFNSGEATQATDKIVWTAPFPCIVVSVRVRVQTVADAALAGVLAKCPSGTAPSAGTAISTSRDLASTGTSTDLITGTLAARTLVAGDSIGLDLTGAGKNGQAVFTVVILPLPANKDFITYGVNLVDTAIVFDTGGGFKMTTAGASADEAYVSPRDANGGDQSQSGAYVTLYPTSKQLLFEAIISPGAAITSQLLAVGLCTSKLSDFLNNGTAFAAMSATNVPHDVDQALFMFNTGLHATRWYMSTGVNGTYTNTRVSTISPTDVGAVAASTQTRLKIILDSARKPHYLINEQLVGVGPALRSVNLAPVAGVTALTAAAKSLIVRGIHCSRAA